MKQRTRAILDYISGLTEAQFAEMLYYHPDMAMVTISFTDEQLANGPMCHQQYRRQNPIKIEHDKIFLLTSGGREK